MLSKKNQDPGAWWMGQIVSYLLRPRSDLQVYILVVRLLMTIRIHFKILMSKFSSFSFASRKHYQCQCQEVLDQYQTNLGLSRPLVGMHVRCGERPLNLSFFVRQIIYITHHWSIIRRTDKIGTGVLSAKALPIARYISRAQAWWRCFTPIMCPKMKY